MSNILIENVKKLQFLKDWTVSMRGVNVYSCIDKFLSPSLTSHLRGMARPEIFTRELAQKVLDKVATTSLSIDAICELDGMPDRTTVYKWQRLGRDPKMSNEDYQWFANELTHAREQRADFLLEEVLEISDDSRNDWMEIKGHEVENREVTSRSKLRAEVRLKLAAMLHPKKYSDRVKQEISGPDGGPVQITGMKIT